MHFRPSGMFMLMLSLILPPPCNPAMVVYPFDSPTLGEEEGKRKGRAYTRMAGERRSCLLIGRVRRYMFCMFPHTWT